MNKNKKTTIEVKGAAIKAHIMQNILTGKVRVTELFKEESKEATASGPLTVQPNPNPPRSLSTRRKTGRVAWK
uniref:Uncharacterized protein n=1 Tax=Candidatus Methanogaster sp. ANME-2c ERB4 TaxID=2759911 RepID=A0A7G9Y7U4_9EURY|nr:hypothetical protein PNOGMPBD_00001 [Methanosarcinales archaeon ANME-2c ERB4]QNO44827.1 hypothetical protein PKNMIGIB_00009 [Methanosarcinales archaeon ANME-2c ERB4]